MNSTNKLIALINKSFPALNGRENIILQAAGFSSGWHWELSPEMGTTYVEVVFYLEHNFDTIEDVIQDIFDSDDEFDLASIDWGKVAEEIWGLTPDDDANDGGEAPTDPDGDGDGDGDANDGGEAPIAAIIRNLKNAEFVGIDELGRLVIFLNGEWVSPLSGVPFYPEKNVTITHTRVGDAHGDSGGCDPTVAPDGDGEEAPTIATDGNGEVGFSI